jgi:L-fuculose-phosphate aldolase
MSCKNQIYHLIFNTRNIRLLENQSSKFNIRKETQQMYEKEKEDILEVSRRIYDKGFIASNDGNLSIRLENNLYLMTPTCKSKGYIKLEEILLINSKGEVIEGELRPSSEFPMHLQIFNARPDCNAIVHTHPPYTTGFAVANIPLTDPILPEVVVALGEIPIAEYGTPSTDELAVNVVALIRNYNAVLLQNHGLVTVGSDVYKAYFYTETVELFAKILFVARTLGNVNKISPENVQKLIDIRSKYDFFDQIPNKE